MKWFSRTEADAAQEDTATAVAQAPANTNKASIPIAEQYDVISDDLLQEIARLKGRAAPQQGVPVAVSILYPASTALAAEELRKEAARRRAEEEALKNPTPGQKIPGQEGIFVTAWQPNGLSQKFNVISAPEDLTDEATGLKGVFKYVEALKRLTKLKNWHGHNGTNYATDKELYAALKDGSYLRDGAGWFIPPRELLTGTEPDGPAGIRKGKIILPDHNLYDLRDTGEFKDSFCKAAASGSGCPQWYWSSTEIRDTPSYVWIADFSDGHEHRLHKDFIRLSCRPVRLVPVAS